jgi:glycoside/pentoside/hexuronide:cation symporter, GPH family
MNNNTLKSKTVFYYGLIGIPIAFLGFPLYIYLPTFYVETIGLNIAHVGLVLFMARLIDMIADPFIGQFSNKCCSRYKLIMISTIFVLIGIYFLVKPLYFTPLWLFIFSIITYVSYSLILIPYLTLNAELSNNSYDNTKLSFSREIFIIVGVLVALIVPYLFDVSENPQKSLEILLYILIFIFPLFVIISKVNIKEPEKIIEKNNKRFLKSLKLFFKNFPNQRKIFLAFLINNIANALPATLFLIFVKYVLDLEKQTGLFLLVYFFSAIITFPFWLKVSANLGKKNTWILSMIISSFAFVFVVLLEEKAFLAFCMICIFTGMCLGADMAIPSSIQSDISQESKKLGNDISAVLFGFWAMITKFALAFSVAISFICLDMSNYTKDNMEENTIYTIIFLYSILPVLLKITAIFILTKYDEKIQ